MQFYLLKRSWIVPTGDTQPYCYTPGESCDSSVGECNNAHGVLSGPYFNHNTRDNDPFKRYMPCSGYARAAWSCWKPYPDVPPTVSLEVKVYGYACGADRNAGYPIDSHVGHSWHHVFGDPNLTLDWYTDGVILPDVANLASGVTLTVSQCPEEFDKFPSETEAVRFNVIVEKSRPLLVPEWEYATCFGIEGDKVCGSGVCGNLRARYYYTDDDTIALDLGIKWSSECSDADTINPDGMESSSFAVCIPFDSGDWPSTWVLPVEEEIAWEVVSGGCVPTLRITVERAEVGDPCPECFGAVDPPEEDGVCFTENPCLEVFAPTTEPGEGYQSTCHLDMERVTTTEVNYSGSCDAPVEFLLPSGNTATVEVSMIRDEGSRPAGAAPGSQTYVVTITIKDSVTDEIVDQHTFVVSIVCTDSWSIYDTFELSGYDPEYTGPTTLEIRIGAKCSGVTLTPPEECDPGCWPECVMCPTRKSLYVVVSDAPDCCLSGTYALTWVGTGGSGAPTVGYYELPAPVGGPIDTCGQITYLRVFCVDSTHITVQLVYLRAEGTEISNLGSPDTLSVICDGSGHLESDAIHVPGRSRDRESLCGFDDTVGGDIRIVSA